MDEEPYGRGSKSRMIYLKGRELTPEQSRAYIWEKSLRDKAGCWLWPPSRGAGYGSIGYNQYAHRESFRAFSGPIPDGCDVHHECEVNNCVNPKHLRAISHSENVSIGQRKGRNAKLTIEKAQEIRSKCRANPKLNKARLGREYGVNGKVIHDIAAGKTWKEYEDSG